MTLRHAACLVRCAVMSGRFDDLNAPMSLSVHFRDAVLVCNELRSESVQAAFERLFSGHFSIRRVPRKDMHPEFSSEHIHLLVLRRRREAAADAVWPPAEAVHSEVPGGGGG